MPALLPPSRDSTEPRAPWMRIVFLEGSFDMTQAKNFLLAHTGIKGKQIRDPAHFFSGPLVAMVISVSPNDPILPDTPKLQPYLRNFTNGEYANPYDWVITGFL